MTADRARGLSTFCCSSPCLRWRRPFIALGPGAATRAPWGVTGGCPEGQDWKPDSLGGCTAHTTPPGPWEADPPLCGLDGPFTPSALPSRLHSSLTLCCLHVHAKKGRKGLAVVSQPPVALVKAGVFSYSSVEDEAWALSISGFHYYRQKSWSP